MYNLEQIGCFQWHLWSVANSVSVISLTNATNIICLMVILKVNLG